jgi:PAS domain S-box-containing protein
MEMTGLSRQDLVDFDPSRFYSSEERDFLARQIDVAFRAGHSRYTFVLPHKGGGRLPVIISSRTLQNSGVQFGIVTFTDISEQVRAEEELRSANVKLQNRQTEIEEDLRLAAQVQNSLAPKSLIWDTMSCLSIKLPKSLRSTAKYDETEQSPGGPASAEAERRTWDKCPFTQQG